MMNHSDTPASARGFTALELIIVLVVGFSIIALSASKMGQLFSSSNATAAMSSILELYSSARSLRGPTGYGETDLISTLVTAKMVPKTLTVTEKNEVKNEWNGTITIKPDGSGFNIEYPSVPTEACIKLARGLLNSGNFSTINFGEGNDLTAASSVTQIAEACTPKDKGTSVTMQFQFRE